MNRTQAPYLALSFLAVGLAACPKEKPPPSFFDVGAVDATEDLPATDSPATDTGPADRVTPTDTPATDAPGVDVLGADVIADVPAPIDSGPPPDVIIGPSDAGRVDTVRAIAPLSGSYSRSRRPTFRWAPYMSITRYRVEFSTTRAFTTVESSFTVEGSSGAPGADLPQGLRFWRVVPSPMGAADGAPSPGWEISLGRVASDVNGDGFSDIALSAPGNSATLSHAGRVYLHFGGAAMDTTADVTLSGESASSYFGNAVSMSGDLNGDGLADVAVGAPFNAAGGADAGRVYVFFGATTMSTTPSVTLTGSAANAKFGTSVAIVGDVNGDGIADLAVGAPGISGSGALSGRALIYYGGSTFDTTPDVTINFAAAGDQLGRSIAGASDMNGDGLADVMVGAPRNDAMGMNDSGQGYVFFGGAPMDADPDVTFPGTMADELNASSLAGLGDYNGDGYGDVAVGAPNNRTTGTMAGAVLVYFGGLSPDARADVSLRGSGLESFGRAVAAAGDVNHDGFSDILVGAPFNPAMGMNTGQAYLFLGAAMPTASPGTSFNNAIGGDELGCSAAGAGDTNGDDFDDVVIGAHLAPFSGRGGPGSAYLYRGASSVSAMPRLTFVGIAGDDFGSTVAMLFRRSRHFGV